MLLPDEEYQLALETIDKQIALKKRKIERAHQVIEHNISITEQAELEIGRLIHKRFDVIQQANQEDPTQGEP